MGVVDGLEFLRTNDRKEKVYDEEKSNDSYDDVGHGFGSMVRLDFLADPGE